MTLHSKLHLVLSLLLLLSVEILAQESRGRAAFKAPRNKQTGRFQKVRRLPEATLDLTPAIVGSDKVSAGLNLPQAFDGEGVVVGVTDIGFDFTHPTFSQNNISRFWDMLSRDTVDSQLFTGRDYASDEVIRALLHSYDGEEQTHGTHVMGITSGSGAPEIFGKPAYRGIAPKAEIVVVNNILSNNVNLVDSLQYEKLNFNYLPNEFKYMFDYAKSVGKPCVANISAGDRESFGDDFDVYNKIYSELTGPGRIIVASAGNEGGKLISLQKGENQSVVGSRLYVGHVGAYLFYQTQESGKKPKLNILYSQDKGNTKQELESDYYETIDTISDYDGKSVQYIVFRDSLSRYGRERLYVQIVGEGSAKLFTQGAQFINSGTDDGWNDADNSYGVHFPGCFDDVICVAATTYRNEIENYKGETAAWNNGEIGRNATFSSIGPRIDGHQKPDIAAPGSYIISSYNSFYEESNPNAGDIDSDKEHFEYNGRTYAWNANSGTSMAAPVVAGIIALWLQAKPDLTPQDIRGVFSRTARHPDPTLEYPNDIYGYGEIDAYAGLLDILGLSDIKTISKFQPEKVRFKIEGRTVRAFGDDGELRVNVYNTSGQRQNNGSLAAGVYVVEVLSDNPRYKGSTLIRIK